MFRKVLTYVLDILLVIGAFTAVATIDGGKGISAILVDLVPAETAVHAFFEERAAVRIGPESSCETIAALSAGERAQVEALFARYGVDKQCN